MPRTHETIRELLPEYLAGSLPQEAAEEVWIHAGSCRECQDEVAVLAELQQLQVPDPGVLFWRTLPATARRGAVAGESTRSRLGGWTAWLWRPLPVAAAGLLLILLVFARSGRQPAEVYDAAFNDPVEQGSIDYGDLLETDIPALDIDGEAVAALELSGGDLDAYGYHREFVALTPDEIEGLYRALQKDLPEGG